MENASKALLMAAGILVGVLILSLMVTLFMSSKQLSTTYNEERQSQAIQQFNVNFTKYLGQELTIHQVLTIYNFAIENGIKEKNITQSIEFGFDKEQIKKDINETSEKLNSLTEEYYKVEKIYELEIVEYNDNGYISKIKFNQPIYQFKCYKKIKDHITGDISTVIEYKS